MSGSEHPTLRQLFTTVPVTGMDVLDEAHDFQVEIGPIETEESTQARDASHRRRTSKHIASVLDAYYSFGDEKILPNVYSLAHRASRKRLGDPEITLQHTNKYGIRFDFITYSHWDEHDENVRGEAVILYDDPDDEYAATHLFIAATEPGQPEIIKQHPPELSAAVYAFNKIGGAIQQFKEEPEADVIPLQLRD